MHEASKNKSRIQHLLKGKIIDIGCGDDPVCEDCVQFDRYKCTPNTVIGDAAQLPYPSDEFDVVHSSHVLEDFMDTEDILIEWIRALKPGGHLILYLPHKDYYPNIGHPQANTDHKHDFLPQDIVSILKKFNNIDIITNETFPPPDGKYNFNNRSVDEYSFLIVGIKKIYDLMNIHTTAGNAAFGFWLTAIAEGRYPNYGIDIKQDESGKYIAKYKNQDELGYIINGDTGDPTIIDVEASCDTPGWTLHDLFTKWLSATPKSQWSCGLCELADHGRFASSGKERRKWHLERYRRNDEKIS